jgi:hypothetical protein
MDSMNNNICLIIRIVMRHSFQILVPPRVFDAGSSRPVVRLCVLFVRFVRRSPTEGNERREKKEHAKRDA